MSDFKALVNKTVYGYLKRKTKDRCMHPARRVMIEKILQWVSECEDEVLHEHIAYALKNWKMPGFWVFSPSREHSELYRNLKGALHHHLRTLNAQALHSSQLQPSVNDEGESQLSQMRQMHEQVRKLLEKNLMDSRKKEQELDVIKHQDRPCIDW